MEDAPPPYERTREARVNPAAAFCWITAFFAGVNNAPAWFSAGLLIMGIVFTVALHHRKGVT